MKVLVFDPDYNGHHFPYLSHLLPAVADLGVDVTLATAAEAPHTVPYRMFLKDLEPRVRMDAWMPPVSQGLPGALRRLRDLRRSIRRTHPDYVCLPYADGLAQVMGGVRCIGARIIPRGVQADGLMTRGAFPYPIPSAYGRLRARFSWETAVLAPLDRLFVLDPMVYHAMQKRGGSDARRCAMSPDPVDPPSTIEKRPARASLGIPEDGRYLGCVGIIDWRKGCELLIHAFAQARLAPTDRLLLVGGHQPEIKKLLAGPYAELLRSGRIVSIDRFATPDELGAAVRAMDLVCTLYPRHVGPASIITRAAGAERPVLGTRNACVGWIIEHFGFGRTCDVENIPELARTLAQALDESESYSPTPRGRRFVEFHTPRNFALTWAARVREKLGLPPVPALHSWDWVENG